MVSSAWSAPSRRFGLAERLLAGFDTIQGDGTMTGRPVGTARRDGGRLGPLLSLDGQAVGSRGSGQRAGSAEPGGRQNSSAVRIATTRASVPWKRTNSATPYSGPPGRQS